MEWNVVVSLYQGGFRRARRALAALGPVERCAYHNILVMQVDDPLALLAAVEQLTAEKPALYDAISRVAPAMHCFAFGSVEALKAQARAILSEWAPRAAGQSFHVRVHQRGGLHHLPTPEAERFFDDALIEATTQAGAAAKLSFTDPEVVIDIETIDERAGMAIWTRQDLASHRLLRPD